MAASYPANVKNFGTDVAAGDGILAAHVNTLREEVVAVETQLGTNAGTWQNWTPTVTWGGGTTDPTSTTISTARYCTVGKTVTLSIMLTVVKGSGDGTNLTISLPKAAKTAGNPLTCFTTILTGFNIVQAVTLTATQNLYVSLGTAISSDGYIRLSGTYEAA